MKLIASLDRACERRMAAARRPRIALLAIIGCVFLAPLLSGTVLAAAVGEDRPAAMVASTGLLGAMALTGPLREEDPGAPQGGGGDPKADDPKLTIGQRLTAALSSKASLQADIAKREAQMSEQSESIARLEGDLSAAQTALGEANAKIAALEADAAEVDKALKAAESEAAAEKAKNTTVEKKTQETVAGLGFSAGKLPAAQDGGGEENSSDAIFERFQAETDPEKRAGLYREHQKALARERSAAAA